MQNNDYKIDELFRSKLSDFEFAPPPEVWDRIAGDLGHSKKRKRALFIWSFSGAASILLAFLMGWYMAGKTSQDTDMLFSQLDQYRAEQKFHPISVPVIQNQLALHFDQPQFNNSQEYLLNNRSAKVPVRNEKEASENFVVLQAINTVLKAPTHRFPDLINTNEEFFSSSDKAILEANLLAMNNTNDETDKGNWAVGVSASPVFRFNQLATNKYADMMAYDVAQSPLPSSYQTNITGGVSLEYQTGSRIAIVSGVNYSAIAQNTGDVALSFIGHNWLNGDVFFSYNTSDAETTDITSIGDRSSNNNAILNTQVGMANINLPQGASIASAKALGSLVPSVTQNYDYKQQARYVEVPLLLRYQLIDSKLGLNLLGGINTNILVSNTVQLEDQQNVVASGKIEGLRPLTWSSSLGMGVNYELTNHLNLNFEPTLKIQLNSLNTQSYFNAKPYAFGVFSGVSYRF